MSETEAEGESPQEVFAREITAPVHKVRKFRKIFSAGVDDTWAMDIADMAGFAKENDGIKYFLAIVDVFSRYAWALPLKAKDGATVWAAVKPLIEEYKPHKLWVDQGGEFVNKTMQAAIKKMGIVMYHTYGDSKAVMAERWIKTMKTRLFFNQLVKGTYKWSEALPGLVAEYNKDVHSSIGMTPEKARLKENEAVLLRMQGRPGRKVKPKYKLGQWVRMSRIKGLFEKGFTPKWSFEVFKIVQIDLNDPVTYRLRDFYNEPIDGHFYEPELLPVADPNFFPLERVLATRKRAGVLEKQVKLMGYEKPVWLNAASLSDLVPSDK